MASFRTLPMRRLCAQRNQYDVQYFVVESTKNMAAERSVLALVPHSKPASRLNSETEQIVFYAVLPEKDGMYGLCLTP